MEQHNQQHKILIRLFNDKEVRGAWDYDDNLYSIVLSNLLTLH